MVNQHFEDIKAELAKAKSSEAIWRALQNHIQAMVGAKLFTIMQIDWEKDVAARVYSNDPVSYPVSGTKPINRTYWFTVVNDQRQPFIANTIQAIAEVFPDHETIWALGCGSVVNWPVFVNDKLAGTINMLDVEHHYTPAKIEQIMALAKVFDQAFLQAQGFKTG